MGAVYRGGSGSQDHARNTSTNTAKANIILGQIKEKLSGSSTTNI
jgi:hypothetical protein